MCIHSQIQIKKIKWILWKEMELICEKPEQVKDSNKHQKEKMNTKSIHFLLVLFQYPSYIHVRTQPFIHSYFLFFQYLHSHTHSYIWATVCFSSRSFTISTCDCLLDKVQYVQAKKKKKRKKGLDVRIVEMNTQLNISTNFKFLFALNMI